MKLPENQEKPEKKTKGYWVEGASAVFVPLDRVHEIPRVIREHIEEQASKEKLRSLLVRRI